MTEAVEVASSIAALDENEDTRRAAALFGLGRAIEGFPVSRATFREDHRAYVLDRRASQIATVTLSTASMSWISAYQARLPRLRLDLATAHIQTICTARSSCSTTGF